MSTEKKTAAPKPPKKAAAPKVKKVVVPEITEALFCQTFTEMLLSEARLRMVRRERASITPEDLEEIAKVITPKIVAIFKN